jgi:lysophospholipase L1-like esterase
VNALIAGNYVQIVNVGDLSYGAVLNGAVVRVLATPSPTQFTVSATYGGRTMPNGDYGAGYGGQPWYVSSMYQTSDSSWLQWLNIFMQGYFTVVANYAQGGTVSSVGVTLIPKIQAGPKAGYAVIQYCTNDINSGIPNPSGCIANIRTLIAAVEELGMVPIVCTPPALGDPGAQPANPGTAAKAAALQAVRLAEQQLAQADSRVILLDTYAQTVNPFDPLGDYLPDYAPVDGIHPSSYGESGGLSAAIRAGDRSVADLADGRPDRRFQRSQCHPERHDGRIRR